MAPRVFSPPAIKRKPRENDGTGVPPAVKFERECALFFEDVVQIFGVPKSVGLIYGVLYASPRPLGFSDIVERLEISKGSASQGLQLLRSLGAINAVGPVDEESQLSNAASRISPRASRGVTYEPELSLRRLVNGVLTERISPLAATSVQRFARLNELAVQGGNHASLFLDRVKQLNVWRRRMRTILPVLEALLGPKNKL